MSSGPVTRVHGNTTVRVCQLEVFFAWKVVGNGGTCVDGRGEGSYHHETVQDGARQSEAAKLLGLNERTLQRWRTVDGGDDRRRGPNTAPGNKLTDEERENVLQIVNSPEFRDLPPNQIVPMLASRGVYFASESTSSSTLDRMPCGVGISRT